MCRLLHLTVLLGICANAIAEENAAVEVRKLDTADTEITATFHAARPTIFDALTRPEHLAHWMSGDGFTLQSADVDGRPGGKLLYVYARPSGKKIEVRGTYSNFEPPHGYAYVETYDFSPLTIDVKVVLEETADGTRYNQTLTYANAQERDDDFDGVARSSRESLARLARFLADNPASADE